MRYNSVDLFLFVWIVYSVMNGLFVSSDGCNIYPYLFIFGCYFCCRILAVASRIPFCIIALTSGWQALSAIAQYAGYAESNHALFPVTGSFGNPGQLGCFLAVGIMCTICLWNSRNGLYKNIVLILLLMVQIPAVVLSDSRTAWLSIICGIVFWCREKRLFKNTVVKLTVYIAIFILFGMSYFYKSRSADGRLLIWRVCADMIMDKPVFGHGIGGFDRKYMQYQADYFRQNPDSDYVRYSDNAGYPYNEYLHVSVDEGVVGLLLWLAVIVSALFVPAKNNNGKSVLIAYLIICMFSYPFYVAGLFVLFPVLLSSIETEPSDIKVHSVCFRILSVAAVLCLTASFREYVVIRRCDKAVHGLFRGSGSTCNDAERYVEANFRRILNHAFLSDIYAQYVFAHYETERALGILNEIKCYSPTAGIYCDLGDLYRQSGDTDNAVASYLIAGNMIPRRMVPKYKLFLLYRDLGDTVSARKYGYELLSSSHHIESTVTLRMKRDVMRYLGVSDDPR